jgi:hypothetical protein
MVAFFLPVRWENWGRTPAIQAPLNVGLRLARNA